MGGALDPARLRINTPWHPGWTPQLVGTLVFLLRPAPQPGREQVLLIHKKTGHGAGKINAPGGKLQDGESVAQCARREVLEEVGVRVDALTCRAEMRFVERSDDQWLGFAFVSREFSGTAVESAEARPFWVDVEEIPYPRMWPDDQLWLPGVLSGAPFQVGNFLFDGGTLLAHEFVTDPPLLSAARSEFKAP